MARPSRSSVDRLRRPAMNQVEAALGKLAAALLKAQEDYFDEVKKKATHGSQAAVEKDLPNLAGNLDAFLNFEPFHPQGLLERLFNTVERHEKDLVGASIEAARKVEVTPKEAIVHGSAYGFRWHQIIRSLAASQLLLTLDPRLYWKRIDGDAALALYGRRAEALGSLPLLDVEWVRAHEPDAVPLARRLGRQLAESVRLEKAWIGGAATAKSVAELGEVYPFPFDRIPGTGAGVQFHARKAAIERINTLRRFWSDVVEDWVAKGILPKSETKKGKQAPEKPGYEELYFVRINAGALKMGGFHPPHDSHHDGSMFDVWPTAHGILPHLVKKGMPPSEFGKPYDGAELKLDWDDNLEPRPAPKPLFPGGLRGNVEEWFFPKPEEYEKAYKKPAPPDAVALWTRITIAFSQCIFLTFPSSTILASTHPKDALEKLQARITEMLVIASEEDAQTLALILKRLDAIKPLAWSDKPEPRREAIRNAHRHHWHINYGPSLLGKEASIPSPQQQDADEIQEAISKLKGALLFREIMGLSFDPPEIPEDQDQESE